MVKIGDIVYALHSNGNMCCGELCVVSKIYDECCIEVLFRRCEEKSVAYLKPSNSLQHANSVMPIYKYWYVDELTHEIKSCDLPNIAESKKEDVYVFLKRLEVGNAFAERCYANSHRVTLIQQIDYLLKILKR